MSFAVLLYDLLVRLALGSFLLLAIASLAILFIREPARRIRAIQWTLVGLVALPCLLLLPGYPRLAVVPLAALDETIESELSLLAKSEPSPELIVAAQQPAPPEGLPSFEEPLATTTITPSPDPVLAMPDAAPVESVPPHELVEVPVFENLPPVHAGLAGDPITLLDSPATVAAASATVPVTTETATMATATLPAQLPTDYRVWIVAAYGTGVLVMVAWSILGLVAVARLMRGVREAPLECRILLRSLGGAASDRVAIVVSPRVMQPCALLWRSTTIVLPESLVTENDPQALHWALAHEWSHIERGDLNAWTASGLLRCFYFYQPLVWWLRGQLQVCQDYVADAAAARLGDMPEDYAEFLTTSSFTRPTLAAGLGIGGRISDLQRRVIMLVERRRPLESKSPRLWNLLGMPIAVALVAIVAALAPQNRLEAEGGRLEEEEQGTTAELAEAAPDKAAAAKSATEPSPPEKAAAPTPASDVAPADPVEAVGPVAETVPVEVTETVLQDGKEVQIKRQVMTAAPKAAKAGPRKIKPGDMLMISVQDNFQSLSQPGLQLLVPNGEALDVDEEGYISFGSAYGSIEVAGHPLVDAQQRIAESLLDRVKRKMQVTAATPQEIDTKRLQLSEQLQVNVRLRFLNSAVGAVVPYTYNAVPFPGQPNQYVTVPSIRATPPTMSWPATAGAPAQSPTFRRERLRQVDTPQPEIASAPAAQARPAPASRLEPPATAPSARPAPAPGPTVAPYVSALQQPAPTSAHVNDGAIKPGDLLSIELMPEEANKLVKRLSVVEPDGKLALGVTFGRAKVAGLSLSDAEKLVKDVVAKVYRDPEVQITHADATNVPPGFGLPIIPSSDDESTRKLQQEIDQLKSTIRDLRKQQSSANGTSSQPSSYASPPGYPTVAPAESVNPLAPPIGPLQFESDKPQPTEEKPNGKLSQD